MTSVRVNDTHDVNILGESERDAVGLYHVPEKSVDKLKMYCNSNVPTTATAIPEMKTKDTRRVGIIASSVASFFRLPFT